MNTNGWLALTEYSGKYRVSISTLRRRIKAGDIEFRFEDGKYLLKDVALKNQQTLVAQETVVAKAPPPQTSGHEFTPQTRNQNQLFKVDLAPEQDEGSPILLTANKLLNELKKAYSLILQEKEEQIFQLRDEVADLKTLVRVLEEENARLKASIEAPAMNYLNEDWLTSLEK